MTNLKNLTKTRTTAIAGVFILASALLVGTQALLPNVAFAEGPQVKPYLLNTHCPPGSQGAQYRSFDISLSGTGYDSTYGQYSALTDVSGDANVNYVCKVGGSTFDGVSSTLVGSVTIKDALRGVLTLHDITVTKGVGNYVDIYANFVDQDGDTGYFSAYLTLDSDLRTAQDNYSLSGYQYFSYDNGAFYGSQYVDGSLAFW